MSIRNSLIAACLLLLGASALRADGVTNGSPIAPYIQAGAWTPTDGSGASLVFTGVSASYTRIGNMVFAYAQLTYPSTVSGATAILAGLPITLPNVGYANQCSLSATNSASLAHMAASQNGTTINLTTTAGVGVTNTQMSTTQLSFMCVYPAA